MNRTVQLLTDVWNRLQNECNDVVTEENYDAFKKAIQALEQTTWIPVSERLPKENKDVLINILWKDGISTVEKSMRYDYNCWKGFGREICVTAWMPLPQPYKMQEE